MLAGGHDFVAAPQLSPDGSQLAWVAWDHPNMPWDDSMLYVAQVDADGSLSSTRKVSCGKFCSLRKVLHVSCTAICAVLARSALS